MFPALLLVVLPPPSLGGGGGFSGSSVSERRLLRQVAAQSGKQRLLTGARPTCFEALPLPRCVALWLLCENSGDVSVFERHAVTLQRFQPRLRLTAVI